MEVLYRRPDIFKQPVGQYLFHKNLLLPPRGNTEKGLNMFHHAADRILFPSRWLEERMLFNNLLGFSEIIKYLFFIFHRHGFLALRLMHNGGKLSGESKSMTVCMRIKHCLYNRQEKENSSCCCDLHFAWKYSGSAVSGELRGIEANINEARGPPWLPISQWVEAIKQHNWSR